MGAANGTSWLYRKRLVFALLATTFAVSPRGFCGDNEIRPAIADPSLNCEVSFQGPEGGVVRFVCTLTNTDLNDLLVLTAPLTLEGPRSSESFPPRHTNGDRYENVLEFDKGTVAFDEGNIMFDPFIVPTISEVSRMLKVLPGEKASLTVRLEPATLPKSSADTWWTVRLKLVYTSAIRLGWLQREPYFEGSCPGQDLEEIERKLAIWKDAVTLETREWRTSVVSESDSCETAMSLIFGHVYSNHMGVALLELL